MSSLGEAVGDLVGDLFLGIYHLSSHSLRKVNWANDNAVSLVIHGPMATVDDNQLTRLVVLAHDRMVRVEIRGAAPGYLRLLFSLRPKREGRMFERCPILEDHVRMVREHYA